MQEYPLHFAGLILLTMTGLATVVTGIVKFNRFSILRLFAIYPLVVMAKPLLALTHSSFGLLSYDQSFIKTGNDVALTIELLMIYYFYNQVAGLLFMKKQFRNLCIVFFGMFCGYWVYTFLAANPVDFYYLMVALFVIVPACVHIRIFIKRQLPGFSLRQPTFIITIGLLFCFASSLPLYIGKNFLFAPSDTPVQMAIYTLNNVCYAITFGIFILAFVSPPWPVAPAKLQSDSNELAVIRKQLDWLMQKTEERKN